MQQNEIGPTSYTKHKNTLNTPSGRTEELKRQISAEETQAESDMKTVWQRVSGCGTRKAGTKSETRQEDGVRQRSKCAAKGTIQREGGVAVRETVC